MTSLEIINLALARIGAQSISSEASTDRNAVVAVREYPFARDEVIRSLFWPSLITRAALDDEDSLEWVTLTAYSAGDYCSNNNNLYLCITAGTSGATAPSTTSTDITDGSVHWKYIATFTNNTDYIYQYVVPYDCMRLISVSDDEFKREGRFIFSDYPDAIAKYVKKSTDPDEWDVLMQKAISLRLASSIADNISGGKVNVQAIQNEYLTILRQAQGAAADEGSEEEEQGFTWTEE